MLFVDGETNPTSNSSGSGIMISSGSDYVLDVATNISQSTISGIVSVMSGSTLNMKSNLAMTINSEHSISASAPINPTADRPGTIAINGTRIDLN